MMDLHKIEDILNEEFDDIIKELAAKHRALGMRSSGNWESSLMKTIKTQGFEYFTAYVIAPAYTQQLKEGRKPGKFPPIDDIERWIKEKNRFNQVVAEIGLRNLAFLIARKIAEEGTKYYQQGGTDLISSVITPERMTRIINRIKEEVKFVLVGGIRTAYEELKVA